MFEPPEPAEQPWAPPREAVEAPDPEPVRGVDPGPDACADDVPHGQTMPESHTPYGPDNGADA